MRVDTDPLLPIETDEKPSKNVETHVSDFSDNVQEDSRVNEVLRDVAQLKEFLLAAPVKFSGSDIIRQYRLPSEEQISCVRWNNVFYMTGTDIVRALVHRFAAFGRDIVNRKKFEEGIFSDLRNLKINLDATLENPKSELLEFLYKHHCVRTKKKQKVFFWYSIRHERLFLDALERELKKEAGLNGADGTSSAASTVAVREPALSLKFDSSTSLEEQLPNALKKMSQNLVAIVEALVLPDAVYAPGQLLSSDVATTTMPTGLPSFGPSLGSPIHMKPPHELYENCANDIPRKPYQHAGYYTPSSNDNPSDAYITPQPAMDFGEVLPDIENDFPLEFLVREDIRSAFNFNHSFDNRYREYAYLHRPATQPPLPLQLEPFTGEIVNMSHQSQEDVLAPARQPLRWPDSMIPSPRSPSLSRYIGTPVRSQRSHKSTTPGNNYGGRIAKTGGWRLPV